MNLFPFAMVPFGPCVPYIFFRTAPWQILYYFSIPPIFLFHHALIVVNLLLLLAFCYHVFLLCADVYVITPDMLMVRTGLFKKTVEWIDPLQVKEFKVRQTRLMACFNISEVTIIGEDNNQTLTFKGIQFKTLMDAMQLATNLLKIREEHVKLLNKFIEISESLNENHEK